LFSSPSIGRVLVSLFARIQRISDRFVLIFYVRGFCFLIVIVKGLLLSGNCSLPR
jgi:hypothetical protein